VAESCARVDESPVRLCQTTNVGLVPAGMGVHCGQLSMNLSMNSCRTLALMAAIP
jgi:hypothetical protein